MGGLASLLGATEGKQGDKPGPDDDPDKPKKKAPAPKEEEDAEPVTAAKTDAPTDPAQAWLAPIKEKFLEARKNGASMAELQRMILTLHPRTKALAEAFAKNILAGLRGEEEEDVATATARENESEDIEAKNIWGCNIKHKCPQKGTTRETKEKNVNSIPKICGPDASQGEIEKALKEGIEWVLKHRKSLYGVCYVKSVNKNGKEELLPLDLHLDDILHANEHNDMAEELWKTISRGEWVIRDSDTDEVYRIGRKKVVLRDYTKARDMGKRKRL